MSVFIRALVAFITAIITSLILYRLKIHALPKDASNKLHRLKIDSLRTRLQSQETADEPKVSLPYSKHQ